MCGGGGERIAVAEDDGALHAVERGVAGTRRIVEHRVVTQQIAKRSWHERLESVALDQSANVRSAVAVRRARPGADGWDVVAHDVRHDEAVHASRCERAREATRAPPCEPLPDRVHYGDVGAGCEERLEH